VFAEGSLFAGFENQSGTVSFSGDSSSDGPNSRVVGWTAAVGTFLMPRVSLRLEFAVPDKLEGAEVGYPVPLTQVSTLSSSSSVLGSTSDVVVYPIREVKNERQTKTAAVLLAYSTDRRHGVRLSYLAGVAFIREASESAVETVTPGFSLGAPTVSSRTIRYEYESTFYRSALTLGLDADMSVNAHLSVVPQIRAHAYTGALSVRPGIAVRWSF
jgi:hypothetical protein